MLLETAQAGSNPPAVGIIIHRFPVVPVCKEVEPRNSSLSAPMLDFSKQARADTLPAECRRYIHLVEVRVPVDNVRHGKPDRAAGARICHPDSRRAERRVEVFPRCNAEANVLWQVRCRNEPGGVAFDTGNETQVACRRGTNTDVVHVIVLRTRSREP